MHYFIDVVQLAERGRATMNTKQIRKVIVVRGDDHARVKEISTRTGLQMWAVVREALDFRDAKIQRERKKATR